MAHQFDSGLFVNSDLHREWHGLGNVIATAPKTTAEAMQLAGMNWTVDESPVITMPAAGAKPILVPGWKCLTRSDNKEVLHVAKDSWTPVQNHEAFGWFDPFIQDGDASISAAVSLQGGKRIAITAKLKDGIGDVGTNDPIEAYLLLFNSHDGTLCLGIKYTNIRVVCHNTLSANLNGMRANSIAGGGDMEWAAKYVKLRHTSSIHENLNAVQNAIDLSKRGFKYTLEEYRAMAKVDLTTELFRKYLTSVFEADIPKDKTIEDLRCYDPIAKNFESGVGSDIAGKTLWGAYNAVTEWTSHQRGGAENDIEATRNRLNSLWFGASEKTNAIAHQAALAMI